MQARVRPEDADLLGDARREADRGPPRVLVRLPSQYPEYRSRPAAWELRPNDLIHWEYIQWAHRQGFQRFDFGSIRYEGQLHYKKKWGCTIADHAYYYVRVDHAAGAETFDSSSPRMKRMSELWAKHMPPAAARMLGPAIRKNLIR